MQHIRKESRAMDSDWALEVMQKAPYITVSMIDADGNAGVHHTYRTTDRQKKAV